MKLITNRLVTNSLLGIFCLVIFGVSSCKSSREITSSAIVKPMSTAKLIRNVESNAFEYNHLAIKKISCSFENGNTRTSFRASIIAEENKQITMMITKLNFPVGRVWLTPDSVKFINYLEKTYLLDDYKYLSGMMGMELDFETVHAIISSNVFALRDEKKDKDLREYDSKIDSGLYVLQSVRKVREKQKPGDRRTARKGKLNIETAVNQEIYIDPVSYKIRKVKMVDAANSRSLNIGFDNFTPIEKQLYPGDISVRFRSPDSNIGLKISMGGLSMKKEKEIKFKVPEKYSRINHD